MSQKVKISCVITLYNRQEFINDAINSILNQSLKPGEIIVIDNSTTNIFIDQKYLDKIKIYKIMFNRDRFGEIYNWISLFDSNVYLIVFLMEIKRHK